MRTKPRFGLLAALLAACLFAPGASAHAGGLGLLDPLPSGSGEPAAEILSLLEPGYEATASESGLTDVFGLDPTVAVSPLEDPMASMALVACPNQVDFDQVLLANHPLNEDNCVDNPDSKAYTDLVNALNPTGPGGVYTPGVRELPSANCPGGVSSVDTDGDGSPDSVDQDDDCDFLADTTESTLIFSNSKEADSDTDGIRDGFDVAPNVDATIKVRVKEIKVDGGGMDFCTGGCKYADPFIRAAGIFVSDAFPAQVLDIAGLTEASHPHNLQTYTFSTVSNDQVDLPENINMFIRSGTYDYPKAELRITLWDHDLNNHDEIDISQLAGTTVWTASINLYNVVGSPGKVLEHLSDGALDGQASDSAAIKVDVSSNASECAIAAAVKVTQNDNLVMPSEVTC
jgi:hypothetical protein